MPQADADTAIAFYTVEQTEFTGWTGGLLMLNGGGRPLEFQCTLPVRPTRAHEILFGATLRDYLIAEAIGPLLLERCRNRPAIVCCDQPEALHLSGTPEAPIVLVSEAAETDEGPIYDETLPDFESIAFAGSTIRVATAQSERTRRILESFNGLPDIVEPFGRIREAIQEAQKQAARVRPAAAA